MAVNIWMLPDDAFHICALSSLPLPSRIRLSLSCLDAHRKYSSYLNLLLWKVTRSAVAIVTSNMSVQCSLLVHKIDLRFNLVSNIMQTRYVLSFRIENAKQKSKRIDFVFVFFLLFSRDSSRAPLECRNAKQPVSKRTRFDSQTLPNLLSWKCCCFFIYLLFLRKSYVFDGIIIVATCNGHETWLQTEIKKATTTPPTTQNSVCVFVWFITRNYVTIHNR